LERASRLIVIASAALAAAAHGWLASWQPGLALAALVAFGVSYAASRVAFRVALALVVATAYLAPALLNLAMHSNDYHVLLAWLAALAGVVFARMDTSRWHLPRPWVAPLAGWAVVIAVTWPIVAGRELDFSLASVRTLEIGTAAIAAPPPIAAAFVVIFALAQLLAILFLDCLWQEFGGAEPSMFARAVVAPAVAGVSVGCLAGLYQGLVDITWVNPPIWSTDGRAGGLALDANTFGTGAAIWGPLAIAAAWWSGRHLRLGIAAFALLGAGMWTSGSRTALVVFATGTAGVVIGALQARSLWSPRVARAVAAAAVLVALATIVLVPRDFSSSGLGRAFARLPRLEAGELRRFASELWNRFDYGAAASRMIAEHPLTGIGVGAFHLIAPEYIYEKSGGYRFVGGDNAQNWWRHQLAELGAIGALPSVWMSLLLFWLVARRSRQAPPTSTIVRMVILGVGVASLVGVPTQHPATLLSVSIAMFFLRVTVPQPAGERRVGRAGWYAVFGLAVATAAGQAVSAVGPLSVPQRAVHLGVPYHYGLSPPEGLSEYGEMRWIQSGALEVRPVQRHWYQLTFWHPRPGPSSPPVEVRLDIDGREALRRSIPAAEPVSYFIEVPQDRRSIMLKFSVSPAYHPHALGIAQQWRDDLPANVPLAQVIR
jgi:O-Antigen ligase